MAYQVVVYRFIVYQNVLRQFGRVVVEKVTECFDYLGDSCSEIGIVLWQLLGEGNEGIERPCLLLSEWMEGNETASKCIQYLEGRDVELPNVTRGEGPGLLRKL